MASETPVKDLIGKRTDALARKDEIERLATEYGKLQEP
jgi:hypothetical protein